MATTAEQINATADIKTLIVIAIDDAHPLARFGAAAITGFASLAGAYQDLASRNSEKLATAVKALSSVKSPSEFFELQQTLIKEGFATALADSCAIIRSITCNFEPVRKQVEVFQAIRNKAA